MPISKSPAFNLKIVLNKTGIAADTLRAWERRYGLPLPQRTEGGHRLYSQYDIETVKWLMARQVEGLSISRAVDMWNERLASGADPLDGLETTPLAGAALSAFANAQAGAVSPNLEATRRDWLSACLNYDTVAAEQILNQAFATHSVEIACTDILLRGLYEVGEYWHKGTASVQQEHFASGIATRRLESLISATPNPIREGTVVLACPPEEWHAFPLLLTTLFLRRRGWNAINLGASVPIDRIEETLKATQPKLVILAAQTLVNAVQLREMARALNKHGIQTAFGGRVFNIISELQERIPAHFLGNTIEHSIPAIEELLVNLRPAPTEKRSKKPILETMATFKLSRPEIESALANLIASRGRPIEFLDTANRFLGDNLAASLELGDISYISTDMHWISNLLSSHKVFTSILPIYLTMYAQVVDQVMADGGREISNWLKREAAKMTTT